MANSISKGQRAGIARASQGLEKIIISNNHALDIKPLVDFYSGRLDLDKAFNWGMNWGAGRN